VGFRPDMQIANAITGRVIRVIRGTANRGLRNSRRSLGFMRRGRSRRLLSTRGNFDAIQCVASLIRAAASAFVWTIFAREEEAAAVMAAAKSHCTPLSGVQ
jgi:hypothetical protein